MDNKEISVQVRNIVNWVIKNTKYTSQAKIAEKLGVHRTSISSAVNGKGGYATDSYFDYDNELVDDINRKVLDLLI